MISDTKVIIGWTARECWDPEKIMTYRLVSDICQCRDLCYVQRLVIGVCCRRILGI